MNTSYDVRISLGLLRTIGGDYVYQVTRSRGRTDRCDVRITLGNGAPVWQDSYVRPLAAAELVIGHALEVYFPEEYAEGLLEDDVAALADLLEDHHQPHHRYTETTLGLVVWAQWALETDSTTPVWRPTERCAS